MTATAEKIAEYERRLEVMRASSDGSCIQYKTHDSGEWLSFSNLTVIAWNWDQYDYRIKPQPKVIYVNEYKGGLRSVYKSEGKAEECAHPLAQEVAARYIELTPELEKLAKEGGLL